MSKIINKLSKCRPIWITLIGLISLTLIIKVLLKGTDVALLDPKGFISGEQRRLMIRAVLLLLEIAIPALTLFFFIAWKYRESNEKATYDPKPHNNKAIVFSIWAFPTITMILLSSIMWPATHRLAPQKLIDTGAKPLTIQVIAMRWKWLFIYPEQSIAAVNFIQIPVNQPVQFEITADETPMSSFWIPHLGGQLYAMTGHVNQLNLMADTQGDYDGSSAEINGEGFAGMKFTVRASSQEDFDEWVQGVKLSPTALDSTEYKKLLIPTEYNQAAYYSKAGPDIYANMLMKYTGSHNHHAGSK